MSKRRIVVGIDPSSNSVGFAAIDPDTRELLHTELIVADEEATPSIRIKYIADQIAQLLEGIDPEAECAVYTENTVMRGAGGATFQRAIGAMHSRVPSHMSVSDIQNSTVKKIVGGKGGADKEQVARGAGTWLQPVDDIRKVAELAASGKYDVTDAIAIAIAGHIRDAG